MLQPQSESELAPFLADLQACDPLLDVRWEAKAVCTTRAVHAATGVLISPSEYDGRWQIIRYETENLHPDRLHKGRQYAVLCMVTEMQRRDGLLFMVVNGAYAPIDDRIVELIRSSGFAEVREKMRRQDDGAERALDEMRDDADVREAIDKAHFKANFAGGVGNWSGRGADFAAMHTNALARRVLLDRASPNLSKQEQGV